MGLRCFTVMGTAVLMLTACGGMRTEYLDSGAKAYLISCKGPFKSWESCMVRAGRVCKSHGYDTVRGDEDERYLLIACRTPNEAQTREPLNAQSN